MYRNQIDWDKADRDSKNDYTASTYSYFSTSCPQITEVTYYEKDRYGNLVPYGSPLAFSSSYLDVYIKLKFKNGKVAWIASELKERHYNRLKFKKYGIKEWYNSDTYGDRNTGKKEGWMLENGKDYHLDGAVEKGYNPWYVNLYPDNKIRIWDMRTADKSNKITNTTQEITIDPDSGYVTRERIELWNDDAIMTIPRLKG